MSDERVVLSSTSLSNIQKHIARYNVAFQYIDNVDVLDIACGSGYGSQLLSHRAKSVTAVDVSEEAISYAQKHHNNSNILWKQQDFFETTGLYDTIICFETIEHLKDINKAQEHLIKLLKPGGILLFSVPLNEVRGANEHHHHVFSVADARNLFINLRFHGELLQIGVNFFKVDESWDKNFSYYVGVRKLA